MPVADSKPSVRRRGPPAPLNLQPSSVSSSLIVEKGPAPADPVTAVPAPVAPPPRTQTQKPPRATRNVKRLSLNVSSANTSQESSPASPSPPAPLPQPRRPSIASLPGASASAILRRTDEGDAPAASYLDGPIEIMPGVWLGSEDNARDWQCLVKRGIKSILNVAKEVASPFETSHVQQPIRTFVSTPNLPSRPRQINTYQPAHLPSGRPPMHYLKLAWSHGQTDLVRTGFAEGMKFVDSALARHEGVLIQ